MAEFQDPPVKGLKAYLYMAWLIAKMWLSRVREWLRPDWADHRDR